MKSIIQIKEGCGKKAPDGFDREKGYPLYNTCGLILMGEVYLCPSCNAQLLAKQEIVEEINKLEIDFGEPFFDRDFDNDELIEYVKELIKSKIEGEKI